MNVNQEGYERRIARVRQILAGFGLQATEVDPIAYSERCPFPFNNFIYRVTLSTSLLPGTLPQQACTSVVPPEGITTFIVRLSNPSAEGLNNANRIQNEVAAMYLVKQSADSARLGDIIPSVYAWAAYNPHADAKEDGFGWVMTELKSGVDLDQVFWSLSMETKASVIGQILDILQLVQRVPLPETVATKFGGLTIDGHGQIVSGEMTLVKGGPFESTAHLWSARLQTQLGEADKSAFLLGWREGDSNLRSRLEKYIESGEVERTLEGVDASQKTLVHGDLTMNNMLYDAETGRITALLDFDWSCVSHPSDEYFAGLWDIFGSGIHERNAEFRAQILAGTFSDDEKPQDLSGEKLDQWEVAKLWNTASTARGLIRPSSITGLDRLVALKELEGLICPFELGTEVVLDRMTEEEKNTKRAETARRMVGWLEKWGTE